MSYETRAYQRHYEIGFGPEPVVVLVVEGTHDVSRLVNLFSGAPITIEQQQVGKRLVRQVREHDGGRAALRLLADHGGPDFLNPRQGVLNETQLRVLSLLSHGYSNREIASELILSVATVASHVKRILHELQATDRAHAVRIGFEDDLLMESRERRSRNPRRGYGPRPPRTSGGAQ